MDPSYRTNLLAVKGEDDLWIAKDMEQWLVEHGVLVLDTRLQTIADAWNDGTSRWRKAMTYWPKLYALLDALTEDADEPRL